MKTRISRSSGRGFAGFARFFDIVNGFLIDAVAHRAGFWAGAYAALTDVNLAEIIVRTCNNAGSMQACR
jgi:hypothetical protein